MIKNAKKKLKINSLESFKQYVAFLKKESQEIKKNAWPIKWSKFKNLELVAASVSNLNKTLQVLLTFSVFSLIVSLLFTFYGAYMVTTVETAEQGGYLVEAISEESTNSMKVFNPVLDSQSEGEKRVNALLYHPLYHVDYPDFLSTYESPKIVPVLLKEEPTWLDLDNQNTGGFKKLNFKLREDIFWSNKEPISTKDVKYSFDRLKEDGGNQDFNNLFSNVTFEVISPHEFNLISEVSNSQLKYSANFSPISFDYYQDLKNLDLAKDPRSVNPTVTSGYFVLEDEVTDPENTKNKNLRNPAKNGEEGTFNKVILNKNSVNNYGQEVTIDNYIIKSFDSINESDRDETSIEKAAKQGEIDFFTRFLGTNMNFTPDSVKESLTLEQKIIPTNTYYNLYLNIQAGKNFINRDLRKYVMCRLMNFQPGPDFVEYSNYVEPIPPSKKIVPIHLGDDFIPDCQDAEKNLETDYTWKVDEKNNFRQILLGGKPLSLVMIGLTESDPLLSQLQAYFRDIGLPITVIKENNEVLERLETRDYHAAFLPVTLASRDPYNLYGNNASNLSNITLNNRVSQYNFEDNLKTYSFSQLQNVEAREQLSEFFKNEFVSINLFRAKREINYSLRIKNFEQTLPEVTTFVHEIYRNLPKWYILTKRELII